MGKPMSLCLLAVLLAVGAASAVARSHGPGNEQQTQEAGLAAPSIENIAAARMQAQSQISSFSSILQSFFGSLGGAGDDPPTASTVAELMDHAPGNVSMLVNGVKRAELQTIVADPNFKATIFVPTNTAFAAALLKLKITPVQLYADKTTLTNILSYHVVPGDGQTAGSLKDGQKLTTVSQKELTVHVDKVAGVSIQGATETAKVVAADIKAGQAVIHVIDTLLLPPQPPTF